MYGTRYVEHEFYYGEFKSGCYRWEKTGYTSLMLATSNVITDDVIENVKLITKAVRNVDEENIESVQKKFLKALYIMYYYVLYRLGLNKLSIII